MNTQTLHACLKQLNAWPHATKQKWAEQITADYYLRTGRTPAYIKALLHEILNGLPTFKYNHNHDPENGQFTSGPGGDVDDTIDQPNVAPHTQLVQEIPPIIDPEVVPESLPGMGDNPLPANPNDLLNQGYQDISHPEAAAAGHRKFYNPETGDKLRFDEGDPDEPGYAGQDHYHRYNPDAADPNKFLDQNGKPVPKGSSPSHLIPPETA